MTNTGNCKQYNSLSPYYTDIGELTPCGNRLRKNCENFISSICRASGAFYVFFLISTKRELYFKKDLKTIAQFWKYVTHFDVHGFQNSENLFSLYKIQRKNRFFMKNREFEKMGGGPKF